MSLCRSVPYLQLLSFLTLSKHAFELSSPDVQEQLLISEIHLKVLLIAWLSWFEPSWQQSTTQLLAHPFPTSRMGEKEVKKGQSKASGLR